MNGPENTVLAETHREFLQRLARLALPIMLQNLLASSVSFIDTVMIGMVERKRLRARACEQMFFLITLFSSGQQADSHLRRPVWSSGHRSITGSWASPIISLSS